MTESATQIMSLDSGEDVLAYWRKYDFDGKFPGNPAFAKALREVLTNSNREAFPPQCVDWAAFMQMDWSAALTGRQRASALYVRSGFLKKDTFNFYLRKTKWIPETHILEDAEDVEDVAENSIVLSGWVLKPASENCGRGIRFCENRYFKTSY